MEEIRNKKGQFKKGFKKTTKEAIIGQKYNNYEVICDKLYFLKKDTHPCFKVKCSCGNIKIIRADLLESGKRKICKSCISRKIYKESIELGRKVGFITHHIGVGNLTKTAYSHFKRNATRRELIWDLDIDFLWELFLKQDKKCKLSGLDIHLTERRNNSNVDWKLMTASLDRIDSKKGYTKDNVQWLHKEINRLKNNYDQNYFIEMCKMIVNNNKNNI